MSRGGAQGRTRACMKNNVRDMHVVMNRKLLISCTQEESRDRGR